MQQLIDGFIRDFQEERLSVQRAVNNRFNNTLISLIFFVNAIICVETCSAVGGISDSVMRRRMFKSDGGATRLLHSYSILPDIVHTRFIDNKYKKYLLITHVIGSILLFLGFKTDILKLAILENVGQNSVQGLRDILHRTARQTLTAYQHHPNSLCSKASIIPHHHPTKPLKFN